MLIQIKNKQYTLASNASKIKDVWDIESNEKIVIRILTNSVISNLEEKNRLKEKFSKMQSRLDFVSFSLIFGDDIVQEVEDCVSPKENVLNSTLAIDKENNYLQNGEEKSLIVNVLASSLKDNYMKFGKSGLFAQNLRFYVKNGKVDDEIKESIKKKVISFGILTME